MIAYLPELYPDELVYSWFCRYYIHTGCITHTMAFQELLYNRCNNPSKEFIGHLSPATAELLQRLFAMDELIINHTMYPQYARFIPLQQKKNALYHIGYDFCDAHHLFAILPRTQADSHLKYCPLCVQEDREIYGEAYWHRLHQIRNMSICTKHKCLLVDSDITAKSEQSFTLNPAEISVESKEPQYTNNPLQIAFCEYMAEVFSAPIDLVNDIPISAVLYHAMCKTEYMKNTGRSRYTKRFVDDMHSYYKNIGICSIASMSQVQRVLLQDRFDFSVICQIAFFLNMTVDELTAPTLTDKQIKQEQQTHYIKNRIPVDMAAYDEETAPILKQLANDIYTGAVSEIGRPDRVSEKLIYRELDLPGHRLEVLPKCKAIMDAYNESYAESSSSYGSGDAQFQGGYLVFFGIAILCYAIYLFSKRMSAYNLSKDNFEEYQRQVIREQDELQKRLEAERAAKMKQQANIPKCPVCGSANVSKISTLNRSASIATVGLASSKIGKQYECKSCKHKW